MYQSTYPDVSMHRLLQEAANRHPRACACSFEGSKISYQTLLEQIDRAARGLAALGIGKGDRVSICMPNMPQAIVCFYAANRIGAVANMIHPLSSPEELRLFLDISQSKLVLTLTGLYDRVLEATQRLTFPCTVLTAHIKYDLPAAKRLLYPLSKQARQVSHLPAYGHIPWEAVLQLGKGKPLPIDIGRGQDLAAILYSGGTTGNPKGVMLTNLNFNALAAQTVKACGFSDFAGKRMLSLMPLFHGFGLGLGIHTPLSVGAQCILMPRFNAKALTGILKKQTPHVIPGVPQFFEALTDLPGLKKADLSCVLGVFCGGDTLTPDLKNRVDRFLQDHGSTARLRQGYGLTECVSATCLEPPAASRTGSVGRPFDSTLYRIFCPQSHKEAAPGQLGEICISGQTVMQGYLNCPEETAQVLQTHPDGRLWLHTGDLGHMDEDGFVYFHQRLKRMLVCNGYNIYPCQLEQALQLHPKVDKACVVGIADPKRGQVPQAYVILKPGFTPDEAIRKELFNHCAQHIAAYALPREIVFTDALPKTALGKTDYRKLEGRQ